MNTLNRLVTSAENEILRVLSPKPIHGKALEAEVLYWINGRETRQYDVVHETKPIHILAFILAYKQLEATGKIKVTRPKDVPFPMTDYTTIFEKSSLDA